MRLAALALLVALPGIALADPLPSWNDTDARARIIAFVETVTDPDSDDYVTQADRVAVFDNDGTLWGEKPVYFQFLFAVDRLKEMAAEDPSVLTSDVLRAAAEGDMETVAAAGTDGCDRFDHPFRHVGRRLPGRCPGLAGHRHPSRDRHGL